jgi:ParB-like chromosome segregation protein Spo0J
MKGHPYAELFPPMSDDEKHDLRESINKYGLLEPIVTHEGMILDGCHRYRICVELGIEPKFIPYEGDDPSGFVIARNLHRRHLEKSQRAMIADQIATLRRGQKKSDAENSATQGEVAKMMRVSPDSVQSARVVRERGIPDLSEAVLQGKIPVSKAKAIARLPKEKQKQAMDQRRQSRMHSPSSAKTVGKHSKKCGRCGAPVDGRGRYAP